MRVKLLPRPLGVLAVAGVLVLAACAENDTPTAPTAPTGARPAAAATTTVVPGRFVIVMRPGSEAGVTAAAALVPGKADRVFASIGVITARDLTDDDLALLRGRSDVAAVVPDVSVQWIPAPDHLFRQATQTAQFGPRTQGTDQSHAAFFGYQWNMQQINAPGGWSATPGGAGELVCDLDTGIDPDHLDLAGKVDLAHSISVITSPVFPGDLDIIDYNSHGTFVAGIISSNGIGVASTAPDAQICAVKVLNVTGSGSFGDVISGIVYAVGTGAHTINLSLGAYVDRKAPGVSRTGPRSPGGRETCNQPRRARGGVRPGTTESIWTRTPRTCFPSRPRCAA